MKLDTKHYKKLTENVMEGEPVDWTEYGRERIYVYHGVVQPKQRPHFKGGRAYTPKETREFEKKIKEWAGKYNMDRVSHPVTVIIDITDATIYNSEILHSTLGLIYPMRGDLDNLGKGILDALNNLAYADDKQVVELILTRSWAAYNGFTMTIGRAGLSKSEYTNVLKFIKKAKAA